MRPYRHVAFHWPFFGLGGVERVEVLLASMFAGRFDMRVSFFVESDVEPEARK